MEGMIMTAQLLMSLSILVVVHEWGHFIAARMFNIRVEKFYLFFDFLFPMANVLNFSIVKFKRGDTEYGIGWFPLGGYVKIAGMVDESMDKEQLNRPPEPWEFRGQKAWKKLIVMLGGIIVNVVVGILIFIGITHWQGDSNISMKYVNDNGGVQALELGQEIGFKTGDKIVAINGHAIEKFSDVLNPEHMLADKTEISIIRNGEAKTLYLPVDFLDKLNKKTALSNYLEPRIKSIIGEVSKNSVANKAGLQKGDEFVEVNGHAVQFQDELQVYKKERTDSISFVVKRGDKILSFKEKLSDDGAIGFFPQAYAKEAFIIEKYSWAQAIPLGATRAFQVITVQIKAFKKIFSGDLSLRKSLSGPIGMAQVFGGQWDWSRFWYLTGTLSMVLAFMNLLPIPALDGGYVVLLLIEMIRGKELNEKAVENVVKVGMFLLILLMVFVFYNDIARLFTN